MEGISGCLALILFLLVAWLLWWYLTRRRAKGLNGEEERTRAEQLQPEGNEPRDDPNARRERDNDE